ncbi:F-box incomplete domain containing protein [Pandoravirus quercus]|uniref:F-box incomplete domain containing protein n=2 Tax=Pandoravirus TaxID=2060084 RepID=A0A2U7UAR5_9VIRU|nr:F-box incomplete domain containing protein [Pandoravirus quercus]AVK75541.1 F-box incomplete domain containing protein [Pandoravirus quercus]QBZ81716.1 F-box incomplete domain containing protein [Pandoravirus celtis]
MKGTDADNDPADLGILAASPTGPTTSLTASSTTTTTVLAMVATAVVPTADATQVPLADDLGVTLPAELLCAILEHMDPLWLPVAARVSTTWYDCAVAVGGAHATMITTRLVDEAILAGATDVALWCLEKLACPWTERRALLATIADQGLAERMGGTGARSPLMAIAALVHSGTDTVLCTSEMGRVDERASPITSRSLAKKDNNVRGRRHRDDDHTDCSANGGNEDVHAPLAARLRRLERCGYRWDDATLACAAVTANTADFEALAATHPVGLGLAWVVASALGRIDLLHLLGRRWMHAAPAGACLHVAHPAAHDWMARFTPWVQDTEPVRTSGWRSWADPPEDALAVWVTQRGDAFVSDPRGHLAAALLGVDYDVNVDDKQMLWRLRIGRMVLSGRPSYERGPYLSESARMARETMLKVDDILRTTRIYRDEATATHHVHQMR